MMDDRPARVVVLRPASDSAFERPRFRPFGSYVILAITGAVFLLEIFAGGYTNSDVLLQLGAAYGPFIRHGQYWRLVMPMFLHAGWWHIGLNAYALYVVGPLLERLYGYGRFAFLYVIAGVGASIVSVWRSSNVLAVGASGAIFGVMGAMAVIGYLHRDVVPFGWRRLFGGRMVFLIVISLAFGPALNLAGWLLKLQLPTIDNWAHLGGLFTGAALACFIAPVGPWAYEDFSAPQPQRRSQAIVFVPVVVVALAMGAGVSHYRVSRAVTRLLEEGREFEAAHEDAQAVGRWQEAARRDPQDERPWDELGRFNLEQKQGAPAVEEYQKALEASPDSDEARIGLSLAYRELGDSARSSQALEPVLKEDPPQADAQEELADLLAKYRLYREAVRRYQRAIQLDSRLAVAHNNLAWLYATSDDLASRDPAQALSHARRAVELTGGKQPEYLDTLAEALYVNREYAQAVEVENRALKLDPANSEYKDHMARYRKASGA